MAIYAGTTSATAKYLEPVVDDVFKNENLDQLKWVTLSVLIIFLLKGLADYGQSVLLNYIGQSVVAKLQIDLFSKIMSLDLDFFMTHKTGRLVSYGTYHITMIRALVNQVFINLGKNLLTLIFLIGVMFYQDYFLATLTLFVLPFVAIPLSKSAKKMRKVSGNTQNETGEWVSYMTQAFQGIRIIKSYNMENFETKKAKNHVEALKNFSLKSGRIRALASPIMETLGGIAIVIVIGYGGWQVIMGYNTAGAFFSFIASLLMTHQPMKQLANLNNNIQEGLAAAAEIFKILEKRPTISNAQHPLPLLHPKGDLSFKNVSFSYEKEPVLKNLTFDIKSGKTVALVGPSGAGKSTLFNLMMRFMDPNKGNITLDKTDLRKISLASLRQSIALVSQEVILFHGTIRDNILYGRPNASHSEVYSAAQNAAALEFIEKLPKGFDTVVGEKGLKLSGGQRQRLSLARAFLKEAPILLLDEATSALDSESEKLIQTSLQKLSRNKTTLIIAHRLSTVINADEIIVLDQGTLIEQGSHKVLLKKNGLYKKLCDLQLNHD
jgi:subfamily B ATP-binding cassette protein MsbA